MAGGRSGPRSGRLERFASRPNLPRLRIGAQDLLEAAGNVVLDVVAHCVRSDLQPVRDALRPLDRSYREMLGRAKYGRELVAFHLGSILPVCIADRHTHGISRARREYS